MLRLVAHQQMRRAFLGIAEGKAHACMELPDMQGHPNQGRNVVRECMHAWIEELARKEGIGEGDDGI